VYNKLSNSQLLDGIKIMIMMVEELKSRCKLKLEREHE